MTLALFSEAELENHLVFGTLVAVKCALISVV
jgi:hypothetical protein